MIYFKVLAPRPEPGRGKFALNILSCLITLCITVSSAGAQSGVLIGLYAPQFNENNDMEAKPRAEFRELWIFHNGKQVEVVELPALMVPQKDGWWRVGATKSCRVSCKGAYLEDEALWMVRGTVPPPAKPESGCSRFENRPSTKRQGYRLTGQGYEMLNFISPEWISRTSYIIDHEPCQYRGFQWSYKYEVDRLADFLQPVLDKKVGFSDAIGSDQKAALQRAIDANFMATAEDREGTNCDPQPEADETQWTIQRKSGAWHARTYLDSPICPLGNWVDLELPASLVGGDKLAIAWDALAKEVPVLIDAASSPGKDLMVAQVAGELRVFAPADGKVGPLLKTIALDEKKYQIVMIEWATGRNVVRWSQQLAAFKSQLTAKTR